MSRILILANLNPVKFGSIEEQILFLAGEVSRRGHDCFLGFIGEPLEELRCRFEAAGARVLKVYCGDTTLIGNRSSLKIGEVFSLYRVIRENGIDLVHLNFIGLTNPSLVGIYLSRARIVYTDHASGLHLRRKFLKNAVAKVLHRLISLRVANYIGVSNYVSKRLCDTHHAVGDKVVMIYNGVNIDRFLPLDAVDARSELDLPLNRRILCAVAMLVPEKGIQVLLKSVQMLLHEKGVDDILLLIVGEGHYRTELERMAVDLRIKNNVMFLGRRSDVQILIAAADIVVVPSVWEEAFGLIIAEAMASARAVVSTEIGAIPELVENGKTGLLVKPGDSSELASALLRLLEDPEERARFGRAGRCRVEEKFNLVKQTVKLVDLYESIICNR